MSEREDSTVELLAAWSGGEETALGALLEEELEWMRRVVRRELAPDMRSNFDSLDIVQEGVVRLLRARGRYAPQDRAQLRALLGKILRSAFYDQLDHLQAQRRDTRRHVPLPSQNLSHFDAGPSPTRPDAALQRKEEKAHVTRALGKLTVEDREVIRLRQYEDLAFDEVARRLGLDSPDAARMRFQRAVQRLVGELAGG